MNHDDFPRIRDQVALDSMLERLGNLEPLCRKLEREYRGLRRKLLAATDRNVIDGLTFALYAQPSGDYGDAGGISWQWAACDAQIANIERDERYIEHVEKQRRAG